MKRATLAWVGAVALGAVALGALAMTQPKGEPKADIRVQDAVGRPQLALLTSLPILFGESFGLGGGTAALPAKLGGTFEVRSIAVADAQSLKPFRLLLMAHPRAQPAEALVDLDNWVRGGGRLLLLADPRLDWHSDRPIGDRLRPPPDFADTGLLGHWGLSLTGPVSDGPVSIDADGIEVSVSSPGRLKARNRRCSLVAGGFIARCQIDAGEVVVIADADFLNVSGPGALDGPTAQNLELVTRELARLAR